MKIIRSLERLPRSGVLPDTPAEQTVALDEVVQEVFRQLEDMAAGRGVELRGLSAPILMHLDPGTLELVLINLVANGIKYSDRSKPMRFVAVDARAENEHYEIRVADNGIGIPDAAIPSIFDRFVRAHAGLDDELGVEGTGLGLAIVDECVNALGGEIHVDSTEGVGTTFTLRIPKKLPSLSSS